MTAPDRASDRDAADHHVARWADYLRDDPAFSPEVEAAVIRMGHILRRMRRDDVAAFAGSEFTIEDYKTLGRRPTPSCCGARGAPKRTGFPCVSACWRCSVPRAGRCCAVWTMPTWWTRRPATSWRSSPGG